jgi:hypothetical protein
MKGVRCEVISFGISTSNELIEAADQFTEICSLPGIFRNAPSGPGMHLRNIQSSEGRGVYAYSAYTITTSYGLPAERVSGEKERERIRANPQYGEGREHRHGSDEHDPAQAPSGYNPQQMAFDHADNVEFTLPDADPCADTHSVPLARPAAADPTDGHE